MPELILQAVVANRYVMREIPRLLRQMDVKLTHTIGDVLLEIGASEYFPNLAKITVLSQLARDLLSKLNSKAGLRRSIVHNPKICSSDHVTS
jgi:hypothetical protein